MSIYPIEPNPNLMDVTPVKVQREAMRLLQNHFGTRFKTYRSTPMLQVQPTDLPVLGVYILREKRTPWGHANHGEPRFWHEVTLGFSGAIHAETAEQNQLYDLEDWMAEIDETLFTEPKFVALMDGIEGMDRQSQYAKVGETTLFEIRVEMTYANQSYFPPKVEDDLERIVIDTQFPDKAHADSGTPQLHWVYELITTPITAARKLLRRK
jgi:hypothetical protein